MKKNPWRVRVKSKAGNALPIAWKYAAPINWIPIIGVAAKTHLRAIGVWFKMYKSFVKTLTISSEKINIRAKTILAKTVENILISRGVDKEFFNIKT